MFYFYLISDAVLKTRNKAFTNVCIVLYDFSKKDIRCLSYNICLTKNGPCRYTCTRFPLTPTLMSLRI